MNDDLIKIHSQDMKQDFRRAALWGWIKRQLQPGRAIDIGGGSGYMTQLLVDAGYETTLAEPDTELFEFSLNAAGGDTNPRIIREPAELLDPALIGVYEVVICLDVLEHIENDYAALANIVRLLATDGKIILSVPAHQWLFGKRDVAYGHFRRYSKVMLRQLVESNGLEIQQIRHWNMLGIPFYFFYEKVLRRPINDQLRRSSGGVVSRILRRILYTWLLIETRLPVPAGLSLLVVAKHKGDLNPSNDTNV